MFELISIQNEATRRDGIQKWPIFVERHIMSCLVRREVSTSSLRMKTSNQGTFAPRVPDDRLDRCTY